MYFFFNDTATTEIYTLSLHDALPISHRTRPPTVFMTAVSGSTVVHGVSATTATSLRTMSSCVALIGGEVGRAHVWTPVTPITRKPSFSLKKNKIHPYKR